MQFSHRVIDHPSTGEAVLGLLLVAGALAGAASLLARWFRGRLGVADVLAWAVGTLAGVTLSLLEDQHLTLGAWVLTLAFMGAGSWLRFRPDPQVQTLGIRLLEGATLTVLSCGAAGAA
jgi:hypothetical protein